MLESKLARRLAAADKILFVGCGGGFDVYASVPLAIAAHDAGKRVALANLSFADLAGMATERIGAAGHVIHTQLDGAPYFPELHLARWLESRGIAAPVYGLERTGVAPLTSTYEALIAREKPDAIVLVDGGTDSVLKGDEASLATITEDALSVVALSRVEHPSKSHACLGFGIDAYHGVCHHSFLENTAEVIAAGGFLGCVSVAGGTREGDAFLDLATYVRHAQPAHASIVVSQIAAAVAGRFGDVHDTPRTVGSRLFVNPLMAIYWTYDLAAVARLMGFADDIVDTQTFAEVHARIRAYHARQRHRPAVPLPL